MPEHKVARKRKLPLQQLTILAICRFAEPIASTSLFPYLPEMVESFNVPDDEIGKWAGVCSAMFSICQAVMGVPWGLFSDKYGRKPAILLGLSTTMFTSLLWGFSTNLPMAITARGLAGAGNGNIGIIRTTVAEMVPFKELQPRAFSLMPLVWNIGSVFGPMIGGALANPFNVGPREHIENPSLLQRFPYALPNIISAFLFLIGITTGFLYLKETLETRANRRDYGLVIGRKLYGLVKSSIAKAGELSHVQRKPDTKDSLNERQPLLKPPQDEETARRGSTRSILTPPSYREVLNKQAILNLIAYTFVASHTMAYDQLLPVFMHHPTIRSRNTSPSNTDNPLRFAGGLGLEHFRIGLISTAYGICGMAAQFLFFPPIARRFGVLNCMKACAIAFPIAYFITPFTALLPTTESQIAGIFAVMLIKCFAAIFAFPSSIILLTNAASSMRVLGTLNGFATSFSALGRAIGPAIGGPLFTIGVKNGYVIAPWWMFSAMAILGAIPVWFLVEGEGFGGDDEDVDDEDEVDEVLHEEGLEGEAAVSGKLGPVLIPTHEQIEEQEDEPDHIGPLSRTTTMTSQLSLGSALTVESNEEDEQRLGTASTRRPSVGRRNSRKVMRRMSIPLGMGNEGISRRYSSNIGQSLGSSGSFHGHG